MSFYSLCYVKVADQCFDAFNYGRKEKALRLLKKIKDLRTVKDSNNFTLLHCAAYHGWLDVVQQLINEHQFDPDCKDNDGNTPLSKARVNGKEDVVLYLRTGKWVYVYVLNSTYIYYIYNYVSVAPIQQFAYMPICLYFIIQIAYMQIRSDIVCVKYNVDMYGFPKSSSIHPNKLEACAVSYKAWLECGFVLELSYTCLGDFLQLAKHECHICGTSALQQNLESCKMQANNSSFCNAPTF